MYIGEVSRRTGASPRAIRLYETLGLIPVPEREGKYRCFQEEDVDKIQIIKQAQHFGFKLAELGKMLSEETSCKDFPWEKAIILVKQKIQNVTIEIERLNKLKMELAAYIKILSKKGCR